MKFKESEFAMMNSKEIISQIEYTYVPFFLNIKNAQKILLFFPPPSVQRGGDTIIQIYKIYPYKYFTSHIIMYIDGIFAKGYSLCNLSDCICMAVFVWL